MAEGEDCESDEDCPDGYICSMGYDGYPEEPPHEDTDDAEDTEDGPGIDDGAGSSGGSDGSSYGATGTCIPDPSCDENEDCMDHEFCDVNLFLVCNENEAGTVECSSVQEGWCMTEYRDDCTSADECSFPELCYQRPIDDHAHCTRVSKYLARSMPIAVNVWYAKKLLSISTVFGTLKTACIAKL